MIMGRKPQQTVAIVIAPFLASEKVQNGLRGEIRTVMVIMIMMKRWWWWWWWWWWSSSSWWWSSWWWWWWWWWWWSGWWDGEKTWNYEKSIEILDRLLWSGWWWSPTLWKISMSNGMSIPNVWKSQKCSKSPSSDGMSRRFLDYPLVSSNMAGWNIPELNGGFQVGKSPIYKWPIFHCHGWLPEGMSFQWFLNRWLKGTSEPETMFFSVTNIDMS